MTRSALRYWGSALAVALAVATAAALLFPYAALGLGSTAERERVWLLTVWTAGVLAVLFGLTARLGWAKGIGVREVSEAGSFREAADALRKSERADPVRRADVWIIATGVFLIGIYFAGWLVLK
ncbi:MAG: hypothetical protein JO040_02160 [Gemmatimonadetes bacterium]|nr:hypothetical protein [Gemmatimonadota bacterium]